MKAYADDAKRLITEVFNFFFKKRANIANMKCTTFALGMKKNIVLKIVKNIPTSKKQNMYKKVGVIKVRFF